MVLGNRSNKGNFEAEFPKSGMAYEFKGKNLGGKGVNVLFNETIEEIAGRSKQGEILCLMCSEKDPAKCHRYLDLAPLFIQRDIEIKHIKWENKPHTNTNPRYKPIFTLQSFASLSQKRMILQ